MRLNKKIREEIVRRAMKQAFDEREKQHAINEIAVADALYQNEWGDVVSALDKVPNVFLNHSMHVEIKAAGYSYGRRNGHKSQDLKMSKSRPVPYCYDARVIPVGGSHPLNDQVQALADEYQQIQQDRAQLSANLHALVDSATTVAKLLESWPEASQFLPDEAPKPTSLVPVELVQQVNAAIGIKSA